MKKIFEAIQRFFLSERGQVVFGVLLIILVPTAMVINTMIAVSNARDNLNAELQLKSLLANRILQVTVKDYVNDSVKFQQLIKDVQLSDSEVWGVDILVPRSQDNFEIIASSVTENVGRVINSSSTTDAQGLIKPVLDMNLKIAWGQQQIIATVTTSADRSTVEQSIRENSRNRYWVVTGPLTNSEGQPAALINLKISSEKIDRLSAQAFTRSIYVLIASIIVVGLLLFANNRLFQYAVLFGKLKEVDQMKDEFISIASHELRTPITAIRGYISMAIDGSLGPVTGELKNAMQMVNQSAGRLGVLVEDLLNVSRIEQGRLDLALTLVDPITVINEVLGELRPMAIEKKLLFAYRGAPTLPTIKVNRDRFKQVLINLAGNGLKYTPKGEVTIQSEVRDNRLRLKVADTGVGMSPTDMERLFTKFYRIRTDQTKDIAGTGLGLWITKQITEKMNGTIEVESIEGVGSQFIISFSVKLEKASK